MEFESCFEIIIWWFMNVAIYHIFRDIHNFRYSIIAMRYKRT